MFDPDNLNFLRDITRDTVEASRVLPNARVANSPPNTTGATLIRPGGRDCYPAFWVRDFAMSLASGFITNDEMLHALRVTAKHQTGNTSRTLKSGAVLPPYCIPDHINFDDKPVYYPGTYSPNEDQGNEPFGVLPPIDDHYEFIHTAHTLWKTAPSQFPSPLIDNLLRAFHSPTSDPSTGGMVHTPRDKRAVGFGFCDAIVLTGSLLFPSLLRHRAALQLSDLHTSLKRNEEAATYQKIAADIRSHLLPIFSDPPKIKGWLYAATDVGRQPDVWGTLFALHLNLLPDDFAKLSRQTIADAVATNAITLEGAVRHIPTDFDFSPTAVWQQTLPGLAKNTYQNGAYWHTPTGWLIEALSTSHPDLSKKLFSDYITHLRTEDFRRGPTFNAPWECFHRANNHHQNPVYMTSVTIPFAVLSKLAQ